MAKITFMGAGSAVFAKNIIGDCMMTESLQDSHFALYDIDKQRLEDSRMMLENLNANLNESRATITAHLGEENRKEALRDAGYVVNAIQVGGYKPSTVIDFEIPAKYGIKQTIADTLGIGGIFRAVRTIPVLMDFARDMEEVCPDAWMLNYSNPMAMLAGALQRYTNVNTVGLCHSVQGCAWSLLNSLDMLEGLEKLAWHIAGINHQAWLLEISDGGKDLYPEIKRRAGENLTRVQAEGLPAIKKRLKEEYPDDPKWWKRDEAKFIRDLVRRAMMLHFGYYVTESSEHSAEYSPYWIKSQYPELIEQYDIPIDEYLRRCENQIAKWEKQRTELVENKELTHKRSCEYGREIIEAMETGTPCRIHGNVQNHGCITNLPANACVEIPCLVDRNGVQGCYVGALPEQLAALNRTNINVQLLTIEAAITRKKETVYHAAMLDPHTAAELPLDAIRAMCDELIEAHGNMLPSFS